MVFPSPTIPNAKSKNAPNQGQQTHNQHAAINIYVLDPIRIQSAGLRIARKLIGGVREARSRMHTHDVTTSSFRRDEENYLLMALCVSQYFERCASVARLFFSIF